MKDDSVSNLTKFDKFKYVGPEMENLKHKQNTLEEKHLQYKIIQANCRSANQCSAAFLPGLQLRSIDHFDLTE